MSNFTKAEEDAVRFVTRYGLPKPHIQGLPQLTSTEAQEILDSFARAYPKLTEYHKQIRDQLYPSQEKQDGSDDA